MNTLLNIPTEAQAGNSPTQLLNNHLVFKDHTDAVVMIKTEYSPSANQSLVLRKASSTKDLDNLSKLRSLAQFSRKVGSLREKKGSIYDTQALHFVVHHTQVIGGAKLITRNRLPLANIFPQIEKHRKANSAELNQLVFMKEIAIDVDVNMAFFMLLFNESRKHGIQHWYATSTPELLDFIQSTKIAYHVIANNSLNHLQLIHISLKENNEGFTHFPNEYALSKS